MRTGFVWLAVSCAALGAGLLADNEGDDQRRTSRSRDDRADTNGTHRPDSWITAKTKMALLTSDCVSGTNMNVDTKDGVVTLHGKAESPYEKQKATDVARNIEGVRQVRNLLQVVPEERGGAARADMSEDRWDRVERSDSDIEQRIERRLENDRTLQNADIHVKSVNNGVVLLGGEADTFREAVRAVELAKAVPGVRRVVSEVDVVEDAPRERDRNRRGFGN